MANELMSIAEEIRMEIKNSSTSWIRLGELLDRARNQPELQGDREFGRWCDEQEFGIATRTLHGYRTAWGEFARHHDAEQKICDFNSWSRIAGLNHIQKARVLELIAKAEGKVTRKDVLEWIEQTRTGPAPPKEPDRDKAELKKAIKEAKAREAAAERSQKYFQSMIQEILSFVRSDEFRTVRSALHPDREVDPDRKHNAFTALQGFGDKIEKIASKALSL